MIETANDWLRRNSDWQAVNCETVILLYKYNDTGNFNELRPNDCCFYIYGSEKNNVLKALRLDTIVISLQSMCVLQLSLKFY